MNFTTAIKTFWVKYATFSGRARRSEYWFAILFCAIVSSAAEILDPTHGDYNSRLGALWSLATAIPSLAIGARRLHDIGKKATNLFFLLLPVVGWIILIVWFCRDSAAGSNEFGESVKPAKSS